MQPDFRRNFSYQTTNEPILRFTLILYGETEKTIEEQSLFPQILVFREFFDTLI